MLQRIQGEIDARARKFDFLDEAALYLIQKGDSTDAITTQAEIDSFRQYHRQVLDRVAIINARLSAMQVGMNMQHVLLAFWVHVIYPAALLSLSFLCNQCHFLNMSLHMHDHVNGCNKVSILTRLLLMQNFSSVIFILHS